jgi:hypothetical protein
LKYKFKKGDKVKIKRMSKEEFFSIIDLIKKQDPSKNYVSYKYYLNRIHKLVSNIYIIDYGFFRNGIKYYFLIPNCGYALTECELILISLVKKIRVIRKLLDG